MAASLCRLGWWKGLDRHTSHITSDQMQWKQEGSSTVAPPWTLFSSLLSQSGANSWFQSNTHKTAKCPSRREASLDLGLCLFLKTIWFVKHAVFWFPTSVSVIVWASGRSMLSLWYHCQISGSKWKWTNGGVWCQSIQKPLPLLSSPSGQTGKVESRHFTSIYMFASVCPDSSISQASYLPEERMWTIKL